MGLHKGDNADNSRDSRYYGPLSMGLVRGFVYARVSGLRLQLSASLTRVSGAVVAVQHREDIPWRAQRFISRLTDDILVVITVINEAQSISRFFSAQARYLNIIDLHRRVFLA